MKKIFVTRNKYTAPGWDTILNNFYNNQDIDVFCPPGFYASFNGVEGIKEVKDIMEDLKCPVGHLYLCIKHSGSVFNHHRDDKDVWFIQLKGLTKWEVEGVKEPIVLKEGDLIFIPEGVLHKVTNKGPRAGISLSKY